MSANKRGNEGVGTGVDKSRGQPPAPVENDGAVQSNAPRDEKDEPSLVEVSYESLEEKIAEIRHSTKTGDVIDTAHSDGSTENPTLAQKQGLVYDPPQDPPVLPSNDPQGTRVAAGFAGAMEETEMHAERIPARVSGNDLDLAEKVDIMLRNNSETANLHNIEVSVDHGVVHVTGTVDIATDRTIVDEVIRGMDGIIDVRNELEVASLT